MTTRGHIIIGILVDSEIVLSTRYAQTRVFINKTLSTETAYQQDLVNRDLLSKSLIVGKLGPGMWFFRVDELGAGILGRGEMLLIIVRLRSYGTI